MTIEYKRLTEKELNIFINMRINQLREEGAKEKIDLFPALKEYMLSSYVKGACAIYVYQGVWYAVENFALEESENSDGTLSCNAYGPEAEAALNEYIDSHDW